MPKDFTKDMALLEELNARQAYYKKMMEATAPTSYEMTYTLEDFKLEDNFAKLILKRSYTLQMQFEKTEPIVNVAFSQKEGYLLEKIEGQWYLKNVLFDTEGLPIVPDTMEAFRLAHSAKIWQEEFSFEALSRKKYEQLNFTEALSALK